MSVGSKLVCFGMEAIQGEWKRQISGEYVYYAIYFGKEKIDRTICFWRS